MPNISDHRPMPMKRQNSQELHPAYLDRQPTLVLRLCIDVSGPLR